ncbi:hypothetical protein WEU32_06840 [Brevundimonas sp. BH3]|uniref:hypothetical protein n=1 Tax=Brevundimonas sp. BH3 TaxID=3133089 RepID=UPI0032468F8A
MNRFITALCAASIASCFAQEPAPAQSTEDVVYLRCSGVTEHTDSRPSTQESKFFKINIDLARVYGLIGDIEIEYPVDALINGLIIQAEWIAGTTESKIRFSRYEGTVEQTFYFHSEGRGNTFSGECSKIDGPPAQMF